MGILLFEIYYCYYLRKEDYFCFVLLLFATSLIKTLKLYVYFAKIYILPQHKNNKIARSYC